MGDFRIYVASLSDYNSGRLHGAWIDVDGKSADDIQGEVNAMLRASRDPNVTRVLCEDCGHYSDVSGLAAVDSECNECGSVNVSAPFASAEEWAIHDSAGFGDNVGESTSFEDVAALAEALEDDATAAGLRFLLWNGYKLAEALEKAGDVILFDGEPEAYAESYYEDSGELESVPESLRYHIDFKSVAHDWLCGGDIVQWTDSDGTRYTVCNSNSL